MAEEKKQAPMPAPIVKDTKRANCPFVIGEKDSNGNREISFVVGPMELETFVVSPDGQAEFLKQFSGGIVPATALDLPPTVDAT